jgi:hypothetical protein
MVLPESACFQARRGVSVGRLSWAPGARRRFRAWVACLSGIMTNGNQRMTITRTGQAELLVAEGERHIVRQREIVAGIKRRRGPRNSEVLRKALELLQILELAQQAYVADRDRQRAAVAHDADTQP